MISRYPLSGANPGCAYAQLLKRLGRFSVLLIDNLGLSSITGAQTQDLLETLEECYGTG